MYICGRGGRVRFPGCQNAHAHLSRSSTPRFPRLLAWLYKISPVLVLKLEARWASPGLGASPDSATQRVAACPWVSQLTCLGFFICRSGPQSRAIQRGNFLILFHPQTQISRSHVSCSGGGAQEICLLTAITATTTQACELHVCQELLGSSGTGKHGREKHCPPSTHPAPQLD